MVQLTSRPGAAAPDAEDAPGGEADPERLALGVIVAYCLPTVGLGFIGIVVSLYLMKFATDVLLVAPGVMGLIFGVGRIWDAISDPLAGYLSDRSTARRGRRRSWMAASAVPVGIGTVMIWSPLPGLDGFSLALWMGVAMLVYETANTAFQIPHGALAVELSRSYHERTRLFGYRHVIAAGGMILGLAGFELLRSSESQRMVAFLLALGSGVAMTAMILFAVARLPEREEYRGRGAQNMRKAFTDVVRNPHARLILMVYGIESFGTASLALLSTYVMEYVVGAPEMTVVFILVYFVPQFALTPMWVALARRFGKKRLWLFSMSMLTVGYTALFFVRELGIEVLYFTGFSLGLGGGCGAVIAPSIKADVIDYDEYRTGERKEGSYLAVWNFVRKAAAGLSAMMAGLVLQLVGFEPNVEQTEDTKQAMMALFGLMPAAGYLIGTLLFTRFRFNQAEFDRVRAILEERRAR